MAVEVARGFVGEDDAGVVDERAGDGDALLFAAGEFERQMVQPFAQSDLRAMTSAARSARSRWVRPIMAGKRTFSSAVSSGKRKYPWKMKPMRVVAQAGSARGDCSVVDRLRSSKHDPAALGFFESGQGIEKGGLTRARRADEKHGLAGLDVERDAAQHVDAYARRCGRNGANFRRGSMGAA